MISRLALLAILVARVDERRDHVERRHHADRRFAVVEHDQPVDVRDAHQLGRLRHRRRWRDGVYRRRHVPQHGRGPDLAGPLSVEEHRSCDRKPRGAKRAADSYEPTHDRGMARVRRAGPHFHPSQVIALQRHLLELRVRDGKAEEGREAVRLILAVQIQRKKKTTV